MRLLLPLLLALTASTALAAAPPKLNLTIPPQAQILRTLQPTHPRLLANAARFAQLRQQITTDPQLKQWHAKLVQRAAKILTDPPSKYEIPDGLRLLATSRRVMDRVTTLGLLYQLDGDQKYLDRAKAELFAAAAFKDWNPRHFLDTAEMTHAFAIGYDWLYAGLTPEERATLRTAIVEKGFTPGLKVYRNNEWWAKARHNWNQVCNGGLSMGALAIGDEEPKLAAEILHSACLSLPLAIAEYGPDGAWAEGPGYWGYATKYTVVIMAAMKSALGTDFGLSDIPGFNLSGMFPIYAAGPTDLSFSYADAHAGPVRAPEMWWLASRFHQPGYAWYAKLHSSGAPWDILWYDPSLDTTRPTDLPLDRYFRGPEVAMFRSAWDDRQAVSADFKAGDNKANHSHLDLGSFVMDALGQRFAEDIGADDYNMPGYFGNQRWTYYRLRAEGHNTIVYNPGQGPDQDPKAVAPIVKFASTPARAFAIADLTAPYAASVAFARRGIALLDRQRVLVQDEAKLKAPGEAWWFLHTQAAIKVSDDGRSATLESGGAHLLVRVVAAPAGARFESRPATPLPASPNPEMQNPNKNIRKLALNLKNLTDLHLAVELIPLPAAPGSASAPPPAKVLPLSEW